MKFPVLWSGLCCWSEGWGGKFSEILATIKLLHNTRVNKVYSHSQYSQSFQSSIVPLATWKYKWQVTQIFDIRTSFPSRIFLLYRHECFTGKYETSWGLPPKSSTIFGNLLTFSENFGNVQKRSSGLRNNFGKSSEIFGKWSEIFGKSSKTPSSVCLYSKKTLHVSWMIWTVWWILCCHGKSNISSVSAANEWDIVLVART